MVLTASLNLNFSIESPIFLGKEYTSLTKLCSLSFRIPIEGTLLVTAMEFRASAEDIARMSHSHPTYAEAIKEAALAATENRAIHM